MIKSWHNFSNVGDAVLMYSVKNTATDGKLKKPNIMYKGSDPTAWLYNFLGVVNNLPIFLDSAGGVGVNIMILPLMVQEKSTFVSEHRSRSCACSNIRNIKSGHEWQSIQSCNSTRWCERNIFE